MDINKIHYFFAAAESDSLTEAAEKCHIGQTTMSKYMAGLEKETGCPLCIRSRSGLSLTEEGKRFYKGMKQISASYKSLLNSLADKNKECILGLACQEYQGIDFLPDFQKACPDMMISYHTAPTAELEKKLDEGILDGIIGPEAISFPKKFATMPLTPISQCLVCAESHADRLKVIPAILSCLPFLTKTSNPAYIHTCRDKFQAAYHVSFSETLQVENYTEQLLQLSLGRGFSILPLKPGSRSGLHAFPLPSAFDEWTCLVYRPSHVSPLLERMMTYFHEKKC
ncbi:LysR family transcriptional regulator [uncultured Dialister sp.]|uniref:LysR family transcriptional regulator n=1 Tax=uncultured Dialister sp. TaxID=278064 RepID=UPI002610056E|nr:LysR family transcriptional regulator [uncultured Dialister sp.]